MGNSESTLALKELRAKKTALTESRLV